jgi:hypothetical protein
MKDGDKFIQDYNMELLRIARAEADKLRRLFEVTIFNGMVRK